MLEFPNTAMPWKPILRVRVSSHMLAAVSPIFARMLGRLDETNHDEDSQPDATELPPAPTPFVCSDSSKVMLYRMPQLELDTESAMKILLHAAHMHNDRMPREIPFAQFVAVAEAAMRYRCTAPVELLVEYRWLPQWMHKATDAMPDGLVVISYAFGLRRLFTRMTKTAILNLRDEAELRAKTWPAAIKNKVWAVRSAKMAQVQATCVQAIEEYLRPPEVIASVDLGATGPAGLEGVALDGDAIHKTASTDVGDTGSPVPTSYLPLATLTSTPRCPKGDRWCDAANLGWLMLLYNELQILPALLDADAFANSMPALLPPERSLQQVLDALRTLASPPRQVHGGVCDPVLAFRSAVNDLYNSVTGLTLYEIDGKRHGWAMSRHKRGEPQKILRLTSGSIPGTMIVPDACRSPMPGLPGSSEVAMEVQESAATNVCAQVAFGKEAICLGILQRLGTFEDLHAAMMTNREMYKAYKRHELILVKSIVRAERRKTMQLLSTKSEFDGDTAADPSSLPEEAEENVEQAALGIISKEEEVKQRELADREKQRRTRDNEDDGSISTDDSDEQSTTRKGSSRNGDIDTPFDTETEIGTETETEVENESNAVPPYKPTSKYEEETSPLQMTEEEARRIIWPDSAEPESLEDIPAANEPVWDGVIASSRDFSRVSVEIRDDSKVLLNEAVRLEKTLSVIGNKQLREDFDRRVGLSRS
jgi:hypothetical protein